MTGCALRARRFLGVLPLLLVSLPAFAQRLPTDVTPSHYDLAISLDLEHERFEGTETILVDLSQATRTVTLNALDIEFRDVAIDAASGDSQPATVAIDKGNETATFTVANRLPAGPARIRIRYAAPLNHELQGFYLSQANGRKYAVTQFESTDARRAFPCFDEPAFKATFSLSLTIDDGDMAISNGHVVSDTPGPGRDRHTVTFSQSPKMSSYLVAMAVGNFACNEGESDGIPIRVCAIPSKKALTSLALDAAEHVLAFYNSYFTIRYPYGKLDMLAVPDFAAGAMENTAAIIYRETDLLADESTASLDTRKNVASVVAHEMAHQWFGDLVTMRWWDDIWLNEGFATWMANHPLEAWHPEWDIPVDEQAENQEALRLDALASTRPIQAAVETPAQIDEAFDAIAYEKGAAVLRMIESYVGADTFRAGVNAYLQAHAYGNATSADFWNAIAKASGKPVDTILERFVTQPGAPLVSVAFACQGDRMKVTLEQQRFRGPEAQASVAAERWPIPVCTRVPGQTDACTVFNESKAVVPEAAQCQPWIFANSGGHGYYRTSYSPETIRTMAPSVEDVLTPPERLSLAADEWALVEAGDHDAGTYLTLASGYGREPVADVLSEVTARFGFINRYLTTTATQPRFEAFVRALFAPAVRDLGLRSAPGDSAERRALRAVVVGAVGSIGDDPEVVAGARSALDGELAGTETLDPTLASTIVSVAAAHGDARLFDALTAAAASATEPEVHYRYLYALTMFRDSAIIDRALDRVLTSDIRSQDAWLYLTRFFANPVARDRAWAFTKEHWIALQPKLSVFEADTGLVGALGAFCDRGARQDIASFFAAHPMPGAARTLRQTLERIDSCVALRAHQTEPVTEWLNEK
jgi:aminopeptidase N